jgi:hypothetical protein
MLSHTNIISYCELYIPYIDICIYVSNVCHLNLPRISKYHILIINIYIYTYIHVYIYMSRLHFIPQLKEHSLADLQASMSLIHIYTYIYIYSINIIYPIKKKKQYNPIHIYICIPYIPNTYIPNTYILICIYIYISYIVYIPYL